MTRKELAAAREIANFGRKISLPVQRGFGFPEILFEAARERDLETGDFAAAQANKCVIRSADGAGDAECGRCRPRP